MTSGSFIPPFEVRQLRDLIRYRTKLSRFTIGEKNRVQNCLTVSNLIFLPYSIIKLQYFCGIYLCPFLPWVSVLILNSLIHYWDFPPTFGTNTHNLLSMGHRVLNSRNKTVEKSTITILPYSSSYGQHGTCLRVHITILFQNIPSTEMNQELHKMVVIAHCGKAWVTTIQILSQQQTAVV